MDIAKCYFCQKDTNDYEIVGILNTCKDCEGVETTEYDCRDCYECQTYKDGKWHDVVVCRSCMNDAMSEQENN